MVNSQKFIMSNHYPPHYYLDDIYYFITARIFKNQNILSNKQEEFLKEIFRIFKEYRYKVFCWVINSDHYHLLFQTRKGKDLQEIFHKLHGRTSFQWNKADITPGRKVWQNYFDTCVRNQGSFFRHLNYIHHNPIKHNLVKAMKDYPWSSYNFYLKKYGKEWIDDCFEQYPVIDFTPDGEV